MSTDLDVRTDSLEDRTGTTNTDLRIGQYDFFAPGDENQYVAAASGEQGRIDLLRDQPFTDAFPETIERTGGDEQVQTMHILEKSPEYTQGLYDEAGMQKTENTIMFLLVAAICVACFFVTRAWHKHRRRKEE